MIDLFSSYLKIDENSGNSNQSDDRLSLKQYMATNNKRHWIANPDFFFNKNRPRCLIRNLTEYMHYSRVATDSKLKDERLDDNSRYLSSKDDTMNDEPPTTMEKISPAYRLIKEAFTELQLFSRVCKLHLSL